MNAELNSLLKQTSRSFYLTLRVLPAAVRPQIGLAYLLARTTDTIADTELIPLAQRLDALQKLRERILGRNSAPLNFGELAKHQGSPAEKTLLEKTEAGLALLQTLSPADLKLVRDVLTTITGGQALMRALRGRVSGLCQPAYVLDIPGGYGKSPIGPNYLSEDGRTIEDFNGARHAYPPRR